MSLPSKTQAALESWLCQPSWTSSHPLDKKRFYEFAESYCLDYSLAPSEESVTEVIKGTLTRLYPDSSLSPQQNKILSYTKKVITLAEYLSSKKIH